MKYPITSVAFGGRLTPDDLELLNEGIPVILPDIDINDDKTLTGRVILMGAVEKAISNIVKNKTSLPEDQAKIRELTEYKNELEGLLGNEKETSEAILQTNKDLSESSSEKDQEIERLKGIIQELQGSASALEKYKPIENEMRIIAPPFSQQVLLAYARKASLLSKKEVRGGDILVSLFNRYITKREVELEGFPFYVSDAELKSIKESLKPKNEPTGKPTD